MPRVVGIDPGTVSLDLCGLDDGSLFLDASFLTADAVAHPQRLAGLIESAGPVDLVVGPSGYGLPLIRAAAATDDDLRLAFLSRPGDSGGIGGIGRLARTLGASGLPVTFIPGVVLLDTVPRHRKLNRVDMGTADKLSAAALAIHEQAKRRDRRPAEVSLILVELGGAFTAGIAVSQGRIVDGIGGTGGPIGWRSAGGWDGEVAFLAGEVTKGALFRGGIETYLDRHPDKPAEALDAYVEGAARMVAQLRISAPEADEVLLSGRMARDAQIRARLEKFSGGAMTIRPLDGFAPVAKHGAQGAAIIADGLAGGAHRELVERMRLREASGTVLDYLYVISRSEALSRLGIGTDA
ncbi:MAG: DUF1464 family protein [Gemmatimonadales bacterium]